MPPLVTRLILTWSPPRPSLLRASLICRWGLSAGAGSGKRERSLRRKQLRHLRDVGRNPPRLIFAHFTTTGRGRSRAGANTSGGWTTNAGLAGGVWPRSGYSASKRRVASVGRGSGSLTFSSRTSRALKPWLRIQHLCTSAGRVMQSRYCDGLSD
jgi:hypothetical protein